jgi:chloramphenicol-sensitive protein RarD
VGCATHQAAEVVLIPCPVEEPIIGVEKLNGSEGGALGMAMRGLEKMLQPLGLWKGIGIEQGDQRRVGRVDAATHVLVLSSGVITAVPLLLFAFGARRIRLSTMGLLQYLAPTVQFVLGVWVYHEPCPRERLLGFIFIWVGLALYTADNLWAQRKQ